MLFFVLTILGSFLFTFAICIPFINVLYKFNIRRPPKDKSDTLLESRESKLGTPIMGGTVILTTILVFATIILKDWQFYWLVVGIIVLGGGIGFIDEYKNTLGRTFSALRENKINEGKQGSLIEVKGTLLNIKRLLLIPWKSFEEILRISGSTQRGLKNHYKFLMHLGLVFFIVVSLFWLQIPTFVNVWSSIYINFGLFYFVIVACLLLILELGFGVIDGLDGLSAGTHSIAFGLYGVLAVYLGSYEIAYLCFIILGAELAFLYFNIIPARVQMSDVGTLPLGLLLVIVAVLLGKEISLFFIGGIFVIELLSSLIQQWSVKLTGKRVFLLAPIHHHFEKLGWSEAKIVQRFWLFTLISGLVGLAYCLM